MAVHIVRTDKPFEPLMIENDLVTSVLQNLMCLVSTRKGTIPMYRDFGLPMEWIDKPIDAAQALMVAEITEAVQDFEPRCTLMNIKFDNSDAVLARLAAILEVEINGEE